LERIAREITFIKMSLVVWPHNIGLSGVDTDGEILGDSMKISCWFHCLSLYERGPYLVHEDVAGLAYPVSNIPWPAPNL
jgi:hypothetical protein